MKGRKCFMVSCLALAMILISVVAFPAARNNAGAAVNGAKIARQFRLKQLVAGLNLSADQKTQVKNILAKNKTQILEAIRDVVKGRLDAINGVPNAAGELAAARQKAAALRKSILEQIKPVLTADQLAQLKTKMQNRKELRAQRLQKLLDRLNSKIGA
jgi:Spy/CpxP family protein refolding chaperone